MRKFFRVGGHVSQLNRATVSRCYGGSRRFNGDDDDGGDGVVGCSN